MAEHINSQRKLTCAPRSDSYSRFNGFLFTIVKLVKLVCYQMKEFVATEFNYVLG